MSIGISEEHAELAASLRSWAAGLEGPSVARAAEGDQDARFADAWRALVGMGVPSIAVAEDLGGGGGSALDLAVALEACAHELVPGPLLGPVVAAHMLPSSVGDEVVSVVLDGVLWDAPSATRALVVDGDRVVVVARDALQLEASPGLDLTRRFARVSAVDTSDGHARRGRHGLGPAACGRHLRRRRGGWPGALVPGHRRRVRQGA